VVDRLVMYASTHANNDCPPASPAPSCSWQCRMRFAYRRMRYACREHAVLEEAILAWHDAVNRRDLAAAWAAVTDPIERVDRASIAATISTAGSFLCRGPADSSSARSGFESLTAHQRSRRLTDVSYWIRVLSCP
jgi:hypothetical protein